MLYNTIQYNAVQYSTTQYSAVQYSTVQYVPVADGSGHQRVRAESLVEQQVADLLQETYRGSRGRRG